MYARYREATQVNVPVATCTRCGDHGRWIIRKNGWPFCSVDCFQATYGRAEPD